MGKSDTDIPSFLNTITFVATFIMFIIPWLLGIVIAKGFWSTLCSLFPPYAWYLVTEFFFNRIFL